MIWRLSLLLILHFPSMVPAQEPAESPAVPAMDTISEIRFAGNKTTQPRILLQAMLVKAGDPANPTLIERSRQAIMDLGLFKSVTATLLHEEGATVLLVTVTEKYYILPIPKLNRDVDNNFSLGAQLRMDNLAGLNQRLRITYETERVDTSVSDQRTTRLEYFYPRLRGSAYDIDFNAARTLVPTDTFDAAGLPVRYEVDTGNAAFVVTRWLRQDAPGIGWRAGGGLAWQRQTYSVFEGTPQNLASPRGVAITTLVEYTEVHDYLYSRGGKVYGYNGVYGAPFLGSDSDYTSNRFYYRGYFPVFNKPHRTLDVQFQLGLASDQLFGAAYSLGGGNSLRGYPSGSVTGNAFVLANFELLTPLYDYYPLRGGVFMDIGNAYPTNGDMNFSDLKTGVGIGLRLKLKSFVKIDLRVDYAYAVDTGDTKLYAGTREAF